MAKAIKDHSFEELVNLLSINQSSPNHDALKVQAYSLLLEKLSDSINKNAKSSDRLATVLIWLEVIIGLVTCIGVYFQVYH